MEWVLEQVQVARGDIQKVSSPEGLPLAQFLVYPPVGLLADPCLERVGKLVS